MTDIVGQLRKVRAFDRDGEPLGIVSLANEAADEIERLRLVHEDYVVHANANVCSFEREIERLRAREKFLVGVIRSNCNGDVVHLALTNGQRGNET